MLLWSQQLFCSAFICFACFFVSRAIIFFWYVIYLLRNIYILCVCLVYCVVVCVFGGYFTVYFSYFVVLNARLRIMPMLTMMLKCAVDVSDVVNAF